MSCKFLNATYFAWLSFVSLGLLLPCSVAADSFSTESDCELSLMQNDAQKFGFSSLVPTAAKEGLPKRRVGGGSR